MNNEPEIVTPEHLPQCNDLCEPAEGMHVLLHSFPGEGEQIPTHRLTAGRVE
jgi:hypothetical protein